jgi:hypothetical protein
MPDNATFSTANIILGSFHAKILVLSADFFDTSVKDNKVVD